LLQNVIDCVINRQLQQF